MLPEVSEKVKKRIIEVTKKLKNKKLINKNPQENKKIKKEKGTRGGCFI
jgi:hypothetical protein